MSLDIINNNPVLLKTMTEYLKAEEEKYYKENPDSLIPLFEKELREAGFVFEISNQTLSLMPKHKDIILPIALKYYNLSKKLKKDNEQNHFLSFFSFKGLDDIAEMLICDFCSEETEELTRWFISDCLYSIRSKKYIDDYLDIISDSNFGTSRQMIILMLGKFKEERAVPVLIKLLEEESVRLHAICALGDFNREEFRPYFERFKDSKQSGLRKYSRAALKKLDKKSEKI